MLKRILSAIVMLIIFVPLLIAGGRPFSIAVGVLALLACKEMIDLKKSHSKIPNGIVLASMFALLFLVFYEYESRALSYGISHRVLIIMLVTFLVPTLFSYKTGEYETKDAFYMLGVVIFLGITFNSVIILRNIDLNHLLYLFSIAVCTDTFAFFVGSLLGRHKLAPRVSPNKSWEGFFGGALMGTIIPTIFYYYFISATNIWGVLFMSFLISILAQVGDLLFSKIKRENEIKDYSNLIPGHGGVLDRLDSSIFVVLGYVLMMVFI